MKHVLIALPSLPCYARCEGEVQSRVHTIPGSSPEKAPPHSQAYEMAKAERPPVGLLLGAWEGMPQSGQCVGKHVLFDGVCTFLF